MQELKKITQKNPLEIADDDHPKREDISTSEFKTSLDQLNKKFNQHTKSAASDETFIDQMAEGSLTALNK